MNDRIPSGPNLLGALVTLVLLTSPGWIPLVLLRKTR